MSFQPLPAPGGPFGPSFGSPPAVSSIRFADAEDGWAFGPGLYATHDGGLRWTAVPMPGTVDELATGSDRVFAIVKPTSPACAAGGTCTPRTPAPQLWRTAPSSNHWSADLAAGAVSSGLAAHGRSVWIVDASSSADGPAIGSGLQHSIDDGDHFVSEPGKIPGILCSYLPINDRVIWSYCSGGHFMSAYRSTDAGTHFTRVGPSGTAGTTPNGYPNGSSLQPASATTAIAANEHGGSPLIRSTDAGKTWSAVPPASDTNGSWSVIGFSTPNLGYALWYQAGSTYVTSRAQLWRTRDAGATWSPIPEPAAVAGP